jgi:hypothetical protein
MLVARTGWAGVAGEGTNSGDWNSPSKLKAPRIVKSRGRLDGVGCEVPTAHQLPHLTLDF